MLWHSPDTQRCSRPYSCTPSRRICSVCGKFRKRIRGTSRNRSLSPSTLSNSVVRPSVDVARVVSVMPCWDATLTVLTSGRNCGRYPKLQNSALFFISYIGRYVYNPFFEINQQCNWIPSAKGLLSKIRSIIFNFTYK